MPGLNRFVDLEEGSDGPLPAWTFVGLLVVATSWRYVGVVPTLCVAVAVVVLVGLDHAAIALSWLRASLVPAWSSFTWSALGLAIAAAIGNLACSNLVMAVEGGGPSDALTTHRSEVMAGSSGHLAQVAEILAAVLFAPGLEELVVRGLLLLGTLELMRRRGIEGGSITLTVLVATAVLFGLGHTQYDFLTQLSVVVAGLLFGYVALRTGNLAMAVVAHGLTNTWWVLGVLWPLSG